MLPRNLPVDTLERMQITREMQEFGRTAQMKATPEFCKTAMISPMRAWGTDPLHIPLVAV